MARYAASNAKPLSINTTRFTGVIRPPISDKVAVVRLNWPSIDLEDTRQFCALTMAIDVVLDRMRVNLRQKLGETYSPLGGVYRLPGKAAFGFAWIELTFEPDKAKELARAAIDLASEVATNGVTEEEFKRLRAPRIAQTNQELDSEQW